MTETELQADGYYDEDGLNDDAEKIDLRFLDELDESDSEAKKS